METEWPIEARCGDDGYILRIEGADTPTGWWWLSGLRWWFRLFDDGQDGQDGWELRVRRTEQDPSGPTVYREFVPSWNEGWDRARELATQIRRGEVRWPSDAA